MIFGNKCYSIRKQYGDFQLRELGLGRGSNRTVYLFLDSMLKLLEISHLVEVVVGALRRPTHRYLSIPNLQPPYYSPIWAASVQCDYKYTFPLPSRLVRS